MARYTTAHCLQTRALRGRDSLVCGLRERLRPTKRQHSRSPLSGTADAVEEIGSQSHKIGDTLVTCIAAPIVKWLRYQRFPVISKTANRPTCCHQFRSYK